LASFKHEHRMSPTWPFGLVGSLRTARFQSVDFQQAANVQTSPAPTTKNQINNLWFTEATSSPKQSASSLQRQRTLPFPSSHSLERDQRSFSLPSSSSTRRSSSPYKVVELASLTIILCESLCVSIVSIVQQ
jgi:hypothetical protein